MLAPKCSQESNRVANILMNLGAAILIIRYTIRKLITNNQTFLSVFSAGVLPVQILSHVFLFYLYLCIE